jgi:hypothetical protein
MGTTGDSDPRLNTIGLPIPFVRIRSVYDSLPRSERKVADYALAHADELIHASVTDLAQSLEIWPKALMSANPPSSASASVWIIKGIRSSRSCWRAILAHLYLILTR